MTERPQNARPARAADRTHNSRRHLAESQPDEQRGGRHRADDPGTRHRSSRVGRHHADGATRDRR